MMSKDEFEDRLKKLLLKALKSRAIGLGDIVAINHHTMCAIVSILQERIDEEGIEL